METPYDYIQRVYGATFFPGDTVRHEGMTTDAEVIEPESQLHYVRVRFPSGNTGVCHPRSLKIIARGPNWAATTPTGAGRDE